PGGVHQAHPGRDQPGRRAGRSGRHLRRRRGSSAPARIGTLVAMSVPADLSLGTWRRDPDTVIRHAVSPAAGEVRSLTIFAEREVPDVATDWPAHSHPMHELIWVRGGTLTTRI